MFIKRNLKQTRGSICFSKLVLFFLSLVTVLLVLSVTSINSIYKHKQKSLVNKYHEEQNTQNSENLTTEHGLHYAVKPNSDAEDNDIDCIVRVPRLEVELPVYKGNFNANIANYNLAVFSEYSELGLTTYTIMGHHSAAFNTACSWLPDICEGDYVAIEHDGVLYDYEVVSIEVGYACDMPYIFSIEDTDTVYFASCDYSLGFRDKTVYRCVKCLRI